MLCAAFHLSRSLYVTLQRLLPFPPGLGSCLNLIRARILPTLCTDILSDPISSSPACKIDCCISEVVTTKPAFCPLITGKRVSSRCPPVLMALSDRSAHWHNALIVNVIRSVASSSLRSSWYARLSASIRSNSPVSFAPALPSPACWAVRRSLPSTSWSSSHSATASSAAPAAPRAPRQRCPLVDACLVSPQLGQVGDRQRPAVVDQRRAVGAARPPGPPDRCSPCTGPACGPAAPRSSGWPGSGPGCASRSNSRGQKVLT